MTQEAPALTIIIVNWNTRVLLQRCLDSIAADAGTLTLQTIVVDNGSRDGSLEMLRNRYPWVLCLENSMNVGFGRANNQAVAYSSSPLLLLLNSDAALRHGALATAVDFMQRNPQVGITGLQLRNDDLTLQPSGKRFPTLVSTLVSLMPVPEAWRVAYDEKRNARDYSQVAYVDEVSGAAMLVRRDLFKTLHGFDEAFFFFGEDVDLCWRAKRRGSVVAYFPAAQVIHSWGGARKKTTSIRQALMSQRAIYLFFRHHKPMYEVVLLRAFLVTLTAARLIRVLTLRRREEGPSRNAATLYARELSWLLQPQHSLRRER